MKQIKILPYRTGSRSVRLLRENLSTAKVLRLGNRCTYEGDPEDLIINWGSRRFPPSMLRAHPTLQILNQPAAVSVAGHKTRTYETFRRNDVKTVDWVLFQSVAQLWLDEGHTVLARQFNRGQRGSGIVVVQPGEDLPYARFYTKHMQHRFEYRVHVFQGEILDVTQKLRRNGAERSPQSDLVRSHSNDWVFCRGMQKSPEQTSLEEAVKAVEALSLDFGGVDLLEGLDPRKCAVCEVNTAVGLQGTTLRKYVEKFVELSA